MNRVKAAVPWILLALFFYAIYRRPATTGDNTRDVWDVAWHFGENLKIFIDNLLGA